MMKQIFLSLLLVLAGLSASAQKVVENSYLTMNVPTGWEVLSQDVPGADVEAMTFFNSGAELYNIGLVLGIENEQDPAYMLRNQIDTKDSSPLFANAKFGSIHQAPFMGKTTQSMDFETTINNVPFRGALYAFCQNGYSVLCVGGYKVGCKSNLPQIWRSIRWKQHVKASDKYQNFRERIEAYAQSLTKMWQQNKFSNANGAQFLSLELQEGEDCLVYTVKVPSLDRSVLTDEVVQAAHDAERVNTIAGLKAEAQKNEITRKCMEEEYVFKYVYLDKDDNFLFTVKVTPDDYNE